MDVLLIEHVIRYNGVNSSANLSGFVDSYSSSAPDIKF